MKLHELLAECITADNGLLIVLDKYWDMFKSVTHKPKKSKVQSYIAFVIGQLWITPHNTVSLFTIVLQWHDSDEPFWSVEVKDAKDEIWAADFMEWGELLAMEVDIPPTLDEVTVLCEILYEMTFYGFTNKRVQERKEGLYERCD